MDAIAAIAWPSDHEAVRADGAQRLGDYELISRIGSGGMGTVYLAQHGPSGRHVALKVLAPRATHEREFAARFQREADTIASLNHPNIVRVFDAGCAEGQCYIAMEYLAYGTLKDRIAAIGAGGERMPVTEALEIARQVAAALDYAHKRGLIHRDVKPSNILLAAGGRYVLTDFGTVFIAAATKLTSQSGRLIGTAEYLSPEQANQQPFDHRVDLYALGIVLYEMLTGSAPFCGDNDLLVLYAHAHRKAKPIHELRPDVPRAVAALIAHALQKQPDDRIASAGEIALEIEHAMGELEAPAVRARFTLRNRQARWAIAGVIFASALVALVILLTVTTRPSSPSSEQRPAPRFYVQPVAFIITSSLAAVSNSHGDSRATMGQRLTVLGRSRDGARLWVESADGTKQGWVRSQDGALIGSINCVPAIPTVSSWRIEP